MKEHLGARQRPTQCDGENDIDVEERERRDDEILLVDISPK
jgi:hypothetical protein